MTSNTYNRQRMSYYSPYRLNLKYDLELNVIFSWLIKHSKFVNLT